MSIHSLLVMKVSLKLRHKKRLVAYVAESSLRVTYVSYWMTTPSLKLGEIVSTIVGGKAACGVCAHHVIARSFRDSFLNSLLKRRIDLMELFSLNFIPVIMNRQLLTRCISSFVG
jgi:hypothetical protein